MQPRNSPIPKKFCSQCNSQLDPQLIEKLNLGKEVFCESCGHKFEIDSKRQLRKHINYQSTPKNQKGKSSSSSYPQRTPADTIVPVKFEQFNADKYATLPTNKQLVDIRGYKIVRKTNRKEFRRIKKANRKAFKRPLMKDRKKFKRLVKTNKKLYKNTIKENQRIFKITKLQNINADKITQKHINKEYKSVIKINRKKHKKSLRSIRKKFRKVERLNKKTFRKTKRKNSKSFQAKLKTNAKAFNRVIKTGEAGVNYMVRFEPIAFQLQELQTYDPGDTAKPPELVQIKTKTPKFDVMTGKPLTPQMRFDPMTGKPLLNQFDKESAPAPQIVPLQEEKPIQKKNSLTTTPPSVQVEEIYAVLDSDVREQLVALPISKEERDLLAKSFIYLNAQQQLKYLEELQHVNEYNEAEYEEFIDRIKSLQIPRNQQDFLISQLHYIPDTDHQEFIKTLETAKEEEVVENENGETEKIETQEIELETPQDPIIIEEQKKQAELEEKARKEEEQREREKIQQLEKEKREIEQRRLEFEKLANEKRELERLVKVKNLKSKIKGTNQDLTDEDTPIKDSKKKSKSPNDKEESYASKQKLTS